MTNTAASIAKGAHLGPQASFWVAAAVVCHTLWTSAAPAMTYPLYAAQWGLTHTTTTAIFAVYPVAVVAMLILFGDVSDHIGRRTAMLLGLTASLAGVLIFAVAPGIPWIFAGRILMGIGVGLSASPATAAMIEFSPAGQSGRASSITTAAQALGLASATLIGGALIQYAPYPTRLNFWVLFVVLAAVFVATWFLPRSAPAAPSGRWRPRAPSIPKGQRAIFITSATAMTIGYALGAVMLSLGAHIAHELIGSGNVLVNGAAISLLAVVWGVTEIAARPLPSRTAMMVGGTASTIGLVLLVLSARYHALPLFLASSVVSGMGYSLLFMGGLNLMSANVSAPHRGATLSALYLVAYLVMGLTALSVGAAATTWELEIAIDLGAAGLGLLSIAAIVLAAVVGRTPRRESPVIGAALANR